MKTVLIVDDNAHIRSALRAFFTVNMQLEVCGEAADGLEAIEQAKSKQPDIIIMDLAMPRMNGVEAAFAIRQMMPHVRIVLFTLHDFVSKSLANSFAVDIVVLKSEGASGLAEAIERMLGDQPN